MISKLDSFIQNMLLQNNIISVPIVNFFLVYNETK